MSLLNDLQERIVILDGAMGTMLQKEMLTSDDFGGTKYEGCNDYLVMTRPNIIKKIHMKYIDAGADIIETNTFGALNIVLQEYGLEDKDIEMNEKAVAIVKEAIYDYCKENNSTRKIYIAGSLGPTSKSISVTGGVTFEELIESYYRAVTGLLNGGIDLLLFETIQDTRNLKAAYLGAKKAFSEKYEVPIMLSFTVESTGTTLAGQTADAFYYATYHMKPISIGLNCATGPEFMEEYLRKLSDISETHVSAYPNAGLPNEDGKYDETPESLADKIEVFFKNGYLNIVGGCCGTTPDHIRKIKEKSLNYTPRKLEKIARENKISGLITVNEKKNEPYYVGERTNVIGSRIFKNLISEEKFDEATEIARLQIKGNADVIDICLANPDRDEISDMTRFLEKVSKFAKIPIMIDSTDIKVLEKSLPYLQGKGIINSINLEEGETKFEKVIPLLKMYGASVVVGLIDEEGMAVTIDRKIKIADRAYDLLANKYGVRDEDIIFDTLVFPVATGDQNYIGSAVATIESIRQIKLKYPRVKTILGISNVSFGLPILGREVLNTYYVQKAYEAGLDYAIVNTEKLVDVKTLSENELNLIEKLIYDTNDENIGNFVALYRDKKGTQKKDKDENLTTEEKVSKLVVDGSKQLLTEYLDELLEKYKPIDIINGPLMYGMDEVGRLFNNNDLIVAEVLQSAEVMKTSVTHLKKFMKKEDVTTKGKVLLATVKGDVHDIGKNLVGIILENNGYEIVDMGINVPAEKIRDVAIENNVDFIGLSGLLVKSATEMANTVNVFKEANISVPIFVGGAALTEKFTVNKIEPTYENNIVIYSKDAMIALNDLNCLVDENKKEDFLKRLDAKRQNVKEVNNKIINVTEPIRVSKNEVAIKEYEFEKIYKPKSLEENILKNIDVKEVFKYVNLQMLMGRHLGMKWVISDLLDKKDPKAIKMYNEIVELINEGEKYFELNAIYKFFKCRKINGKIEILDDTSEEILEKFEFPRQQQGEHMSLVDYIHPIEMDYIGIFVASVGEKTTKISNVLKEQGELYKSHLVMSIGLELAESLSEYVHYKMREDLGIVENTEFNIDYILKSKYQGKRYSFGYPACPDLSYQEKLFRLLKPENKIKTKLTEGYMMYPESSVSAIVFSQPFCKYFNV